jgi:hypothetical protein
MKYIASFLLVMFALLPMSFGQAKQVAPAGGIDTPQINHLVICDNHYASLQQCVNVAGTTSSVLVPYAQHPGETYSNPHSVTVLDIRQTLPSGANPAGTIFQDQLNNGSGGLAAGITHGGPNNLDLLNPGAIQAFRLNYVTPGTDTQTYPHQHTNIYNSSSSKRYMSNDDITHTMLNLYIPSGGKNYSNQYSGGESTAFEKPNHAILTLNSLKQTEGQGGGYFASLVKNLGVGDTMMNTQQGVATGVSDGDDEGLKFFRANLIHNPSRFGMSITSIASDSYGNYVFRGTNTGSYNGLPSEGLPVINLSKDLNPSQTGNITDIRAYAADNRFAQVTPDTGINIATLLGNSTVSYTTSSIVPSNLSAGILTAKNGSGGLSSATVTVTNATGFTASSTIPVCIGSVAANYEQTYISAVNTSTNTLTLQYARYQHGTNDMVSQGGACGYAIAMSADEKAPGTVPANDLASQTTTLHNAYYVMGTISGNFIVYTNMHASADAVLHTAAYTNTTPLVAGTLTPSVGGGQLNGLAINGDANYSNYRGNFVGQTTLAYPTITFSGGGCTTQPVASVTSYARPSASQILPVITITNPGAGCSGSLTATMQSSYANPYHLYPATVSFKVIDPSAAIDPNTGEPSASGNYVMTEAVNPANWANGDTLEISGWWNQYAGSNVTLGTIYGGQSNNFSLRHALLFAGDWAGSEPVGNTLSGIVNRTPSSHYYSPNGPSPGVAYELPPDGFELGGMMKNSIWTSDAPTDSVMAVRCVSGGSFYVDALSPCNFGVAQSYHIWKGFTASNIAAYDSIDYNNGTRTITYNVPNFVFQNGNISFGSTSGFGTTPSFHTGLQIKHDNGVTFVNDNGPTQIIHICNPLFSASNVLGVGACHPRAGDTADYNFDGRWDAGYLNANVASRTPALSVSLAPPVFLGSATWSGTGSGHNYQFVFAAISPLGIMGPISADTLGVFNQGTLGGGNSITISCSTTAAQIGYPSGTTIAALLPDGAGNYINEGTCGSGGTITVDGSHTTNVVLPTHAYNSFIGAGQYRVEASGDISFLPSQTTETGDTHIARTGANDVSIGSTKGASDGALHVGSLTIGGNAVCQSTGTNCPSSGGGTPLGGTVTLTSPSSGIEGGICWSNTVTVTGATVGHAVAVSTADGSDGNAFSIVKATVSAANTIKVQECAYATAPFDPTTTYAVSTY